MAITVDLSDIDLASLIEQETQTVSFGKEHGFSEKKTRKASCPWCGGRDRFAVVNSDPQHFYCGIHGGSGCGKSGDAVKFMRLWHNISFTEACKRLGVTPTNDGKPLEPRQPRVHANIDRIPVEQWRMTADFFLRHCQARLWHERIGKEARELLHQRGFTDEYIRERGYGLYPTTSFDKDKARWGIEDPDAKAVWLPRGIVIPWYVGSDLWKLNIRRPSEDLAEEKKRTGRDANKYVNVKGGSNPIYRADTIKPGQPLVLFEGEINADILAMVLRNAGIEHINVVATGSTGKGRADNWLAKIAKASPILISFDPDGAGAKAAKDYWHKVLPHALLWPSRGGDLNDMYLAGVDVMKWLNKGLKIAGSEVVSSEPAPVEPAPAPEAPQLTEEELWLQEVALLPRLCNACLDEGIETPIADDVDACPAHQSAPAALRMLTQDEIAQQVANATGMDLILREVFPVSEEAAVKARVEQEYQQMIAEEHARPVYTRHIIQDFTIQPDWTKHGFVKDEKGNWREKNRYEKELKEAALAAKKKKLGIVEKVKESKAGYTPDPGHVSYSHDDLAQMGLSMMDYMHQLDNENVARRALKDLDLPMFSEKYSAQKVEM